VFQNDVSQGLLGSVSDGERDVFRAEFSGDGCGLAVELNGRTLAFWAHNFDIAPADTVTPSRAQGFHSGFLGGETRGIAFKPGGFSFAVTNFTFGEDAMKKAVTEALDAFADAGNFGDVHSGAENHGNIVNWQFGFGNLDFAQATEFSVSTRSASCSGNTVRRSTRTRPSSTRAITGGELARRRAFSWSALRSAWVSAIRRVGKTADGAAPPPMTDSPSRSSSLSFVPAIPETIFPARRAISSFDRRIMRSTGTASWSRLT